MRFIITLLIVTGFAISCGNASEKDQNQAPSNDASIIFGSRDFTFPPLSPPAQEQAEHWGILEDFLSEAKNMNGSNYQKLRNLSERLREYSDSLMGKIPDTLNTKPIHSRLTVLKTRSAMLYQASHLDRIDSIKVQNSVEEMNAAIKNLIVHLNEKFQKDNIDYQRQEVEDQELKKQQRFRDSIMDLELQDKRN